jgi:light-regulated signal transduction histidine kinase (bacteriophytochrome)
LQREIEQHKQAQEEVTWLNEDLIRQQNALVIANRELEAFSYSVSHDLRAPLRHLCGFVNILLEDHVDALDETATMYLSRIYNASQKMGALIDSLLELSRISRYKMHISSVYLTLLAREIAESLQDTAPNRHVTWQIAEDLVVQADETLMRNVLENLLGNAWKYTGQKDLAIIEFASCIQGGEQVYFVRDNGTGFDMAHRDKLFGAFQRLHGTEFDGMGIGLATVQRIIHRHNGDIWAEAAQDEGATFYFTLSKQ